VEVRLAATDGRVDRRIWRRRTAVGVKSWTFVPATGGERDGAEQQQKDRGPQALVVDPFHVLPSGFRRDKRTDAANNARYAPESHSPWLETSLKNG
jgi:hypothetical protein